MADDEEEEKILCLAFNQEATCFAVGTDSGFGVFNILPFMPIVKRNMMGGIGLIEMLGQTNIFALVGGGSKPRFPQKKVIIWNEIEGYPLSELSFSSDVKNIKMKRENLFAILENKIFMFEMQKFTLIEKFDTYTNPIGVFTITSNLYTNIIAFPDKGLGAITIRSFDEGNLGCSFMKIHNTPVSCLQINNIGSLLATASDYGTVIKIVNLKDCTVALELRRGTEKAIIYSLSFDYFSRFIACTSDRGTVHIFSLEDLYDTNDNKTKKQVKDEKEDGFGIADNTADTKEIVEKPKKNSTSVFKNFLGGMFGYFKSEWSFARLRIRDLKSICIFAGNKNNKIVVVSNEWNYYEAAFDLEKGGDCEKINQSAIELNFDENEGEQEHKLDNDNAPK